MSSHSNDNYENHEEVGTSSNYFSIDSYVLPRNLKGVFCGSGSDMMSDVRPAKAIVEMVGKPANEIQVVYIGTATYDLEVFKTRQTQRFADMGCKVSALEIANDDSIESSQIESLLDSADVIVVGGGNTLYAVDRWRKFNVVPYMRKAMMRGAVISGGSAGAICWFDGGHSNATDPETYRDFRLEKYGASSGDSSNQDQGGDEIDTSADQIADWEYIRVPTLGFLPGLVSPHHDRTQSNGVLRANDFDRQLLETPGELGIGIDHWAALIVEGECYRVLSLQEKGGSLKDGGKFVTDGSGEPTVWIKEVVDGRVEQRLCPSEGRLADLLRAPTSIVNDEEALDRCRAENPQA